MGNSAGSAMDEMGIIEESLEYKLNALKETWVGVWQNLLDRGDLGNVIDMLTELSEAVDMITEKFGLFGTVAGVAGIGLIGKNFGKNIAHYGREARIA